ncbi:MAG: helix-hairpin-helix domain-containing protein [Steroidobacteraceae bacterium]
MSQGLLNGLGARLMAGMGPAAVLAGVMGLGLAAPAGATAAAAPTAHPPVSGAATAVPGMPATGMPTRPVDGYTQRIKTHAKPAAPIDINHASLEQLKGLPGISEAQAKLIIEKRPYHSKAQLVTANVLPAGVFQSIRHMIIAIQPGPTRPSKHP